MAKTGRPSKYKPELVERIYHYIEAGLNDEDAALLAGISLQTFYTWKKEKPEFSEGIKKAKARFKEAGIKNIREAAKKDWKAWAWLLERKFPEEFAKRDNFNVSGDVGILIQIERPKPNKRSDK